MALFRRKAYQQLLQWKRESHGRSAMLIKGARRVGKSTLVQTFAANEYRHHLVIDFSTVPNDVLALFSDYRDDVDSFFKYLRLYYPKAVIEPGQTLIVFDEVQLCPQARSFIKQLVADGRCDYVETGSLISIQANSANILLPSEEENMELNPMDFEEFLRAQDREALAEAIRESFATLTPLPDGIHRLASRLFREYMLVGGMPQAVAAYLETNDFHAADLEKRRITTLYENDMAKYGGTDSHKIANIYRTVPGQLAKHEKRFTMASLGPSARYQRYESSFFWLADAGLVNLCRNTTDPAVGLAASSSETAFKCYMADTGLLASYAFADNATTTNELYRDILRDKLSVNEGMLTENIVAQQLKAAGHALYFYTRNDPDTRKNRIEVDFLITRPFDHAAMKSRISPIEVKSSPRYRTVSLDKFKSVFGSKVGTTIVLHPKPLTHEGERLYLPLYMSGLI